MEYSLLRRTLLANAGFSAVSGLTMAVDRNPLAGFLGIAPDVLAPVGISLIAYGAVLVALTRRPGALRPAGIGAVALDLAWVAGTVALIVSGAFTADGAWLVGATSTIVLGFAATQARGLETGR